MSDRHPLPEILHGERVSLKKHTREVAEVMFQAVDRDRERLNRYLPWVSGTLKLEDEIRYIEMTREKWQAETLFDFGLFRKSDGAYMGNIGVHSISWTGMRCELGYWILSEFEGQGFMTEAVRVLSEAVFAAGANRIEIRCDPQNERSAAVPKRLGFRFDACLRDASIGNDGEPRDSFVFSRLKSDGPFSSKKTVGTKRPDFIRHWQELREPDDSHYANSDELLSIGSPLARKLGLTRIGIHHELLPPGRRTSWPHAESLEEEFGFVIEGYPHVWIDGVLHQLSPGDAVAFPAGTGIAHTFINNTSEDVRLIVVGEASKKENKIFYPRNPELAKTRKDWWTDAPKRELGDHDGLPDDLRKKK